MFRFLLHRIGYGFLVLIGVVIAVFILFLALPGDPARLTMGQRTDLATLENVNRELGLDKTKPVQFLLYLNDLSPVSVLQNDAGSLKKYHFTKLFSISSSSFIALKLPFLRTSYQTSRPVGAMLMQALPNTIVLAVTAMIIALVIGIFSGVISAVNHNTWLDSVMIFSSVLGISVPSFFAAILFQWLFAFVLAGITGLKMTGSLFEPDFYGNDRLMLLNLILPAITLGIRPIAIITQLTRSSMLDVLSQDYVRTARAKGLSEKIIRYRHALRNALNPVLTAASGWFAEMLAGAFFIEMIFGWNGIGKLTVDALNKNDFPVVMGSVLFSATIFVILNIITDILYGVLDPIVRKH
jgi:peptide/nickel transport system permease protein